MFDGSVGNEAVSFREMHGNRGVCEPIWLEMYALGCRLYLLDLFHLLLCHYLERCVLSGMLDA